MTDTTQPRTHLTDAELDEARAELRADADHHLGYIDPDGVRSINANTAAALRQRDEARAELGRALELIAELRDVAERADRAFARYDTAWPHRAEDEFGPHLARQLNDPEVRAAYDAEQLARVAEPTWDDVYAAIGSEIWKLAPQTHRDAGHRDLTFTANWQNIMAAVENGITACYPDAADLGSPSRAQGAAGPAEINAGGPTGVTGSRGMGRDANGAQKPTQAETAESDTTEYLIWSHHHKAWWGPNGSGYRSNITNAGRYTLAATKRRLGRGCRCCRVPEVVIPAPDAEVFAQPGRADAWADEAIKAATAARIERGEVNTWAVAEDGAQR